MKDQIKQVAELLVRSRRVMALTGAGLSVESGIPASASLVLPQMVEELEARLKP
jgi:hypothetical protein